MKNKMIILPAALIFLFTSFKPIQDELFYGESKLTSCQLNLPFFYTKKSDKEVSKKAKELMNKELVLLHVDPNTGDVTYGRYFLLAETDAKSKTVSGYLVRVEEYKSGKPVAVHPKYSDKTDRFYMADCFDEVLKNNPDIKQKMIEEGKLP